MSGALHLVVREEETRRRLGRELHDDLGQRAGSLGFELRALRNRFEEDDVRRDQLDAVGRRLGELGEDLRRLSRDLHPATLEARGLPAALRDLAAETERRYGLRVEVAVGDVGGAEPQVPKEAALALYRIAQEALANAARHSGARTLRLALRAGRVTVGLSLADDGAGFDPEAARRAGGLGLASIQERARVLGGRCRIVSAVGAGTSVEASVPRHRLSRWARRRRGWLAAAALILAALGAGVTATLVQARRTAAEAARAEAAVGFLEELFIAADPRQARGVLPDLREILRRGSDRLARELEDQPLVRARLLDTLGGIHTELGLYDQARPLLEQALALRRQLLDGEDPEVAATLVRLGSLAHLSGEGDAETLFRSALAIREAGARRAPAELADVLNKLGAVLASRGRLEEAEVAMRRALALYEERFGPADRRVAKILHNLSGIAFYRQQPEVSEELLVRALAIREATLAEDDPDLAGSREALALLRRQQGRPAEAAELLERLAATAERVWGPEHPELARVLLNLGLARADLGELEAADELFERAMAINDEALAPEQPAFILALAALAEHHLKQGRLGDAEPLYQRLMAMHERGVPYQLWGPVLEQWGQLQEKLRAAEAGAG